MKLSAFIAAMLGLTLALALIAWQGFGSVAAALVSAGWGLLVVTAYYLFPMWLDAIGWTSPAGAVRDTAVAAVAQW